MLMPDDPIRPHAGTTGGSSKRVPVASIRSHARGITHCRAARAAAAASAVAVAAARALGVMTALALVAQAAAPRIAGAEAILPFRPALADPRESAAHARVSSFKQDFRTGTDVLDPTSRGGWDLGVDGVSFDLGGGRFFRGPGWDRLLGWRGPWRAYAVHVSALAFTNLDRIGDQLVTVADYQFGGGVEVQWTGAGDATRGALGFDRPVLSSRTALLHRSSHVGDEYVTQLAFASNLRDDGGPRSALTAAPVRSTALSYEVLHHLFAVEWAPAGGASTVRAYGGGEIKVGISDRKPWRFKSPTAQFGLEWRSAGNLADPGPDPVTGALHRALGRDVAGLAWFAAADLRLAKPFNFAGCDNPDGCDEVWTPTLWTRCLNGREFGGYAGTWRGLVGVTLFDRGRRSVGRGGRLVGPETAITLEWSRGYSWHGQFMDSRRREHPRWYVVPGVTISY